MGTPHVTSFCWCLSLERGSKLIGFLHLITSIFIVGLCTVYALEFKDASHTAEDAGDHLYTTSYWLTVAVAIVNTVHVLLAASLLYGAFRHRSGWLRVWVGGMCVLWLVAVVCCIRSFIAAGVEGSGSDIFVNFLIGLLFFGVSVYCIVVVHSRYKQMMQEEADKHTARYLFVNTHRSSAV